MKDFNIYIYFLIACVGTLIFFLLIREIICWYYKINESLSLQIKLNELLEKLVSNENIIQESSIINFGNIEIARNDCGFTKNWTDAKRYCEELGNGWRLPTKNELEILYKNKNLINGFSNSGYWSSTEDIYNYAWGQGFSDGKQAVAKKEIFLNVRAVRDKN